MEAPGKLTPIEVAVGAIVDIAGSRVLLAKRASDAHQGGLWEFPGGKVEMGETIAQGLARELREELGITATDCKPLLRIEHEYHDRSVALDVWLVTGFKGVPKGRQGQPLHWASIAQLHEIDFPEANQAIVAELQRRLL